MPLEDSTTDEPSSSDEEGVAVTLWCNTQHAAVIAVPCYTSGEEDGLGPRIQTRHEWRQRHARGGRSSKFSRATRPYRMHYFHNQHLRSLWLDPGFNELLDSQPHAGAQVPSQDYAAASATGGMDRFWSGVGEPVLLTGLPGVTRVQSNFAPEVLAQHETVCTVCEPFDGADGKLRLKDFFRLCQRHKKADVPFYVFDQGFGGCTHTGGAYGAPDRWAGQRVQTCFSRHQLGFKYSIPSLFSHCDLKMVDHRPALQLPRGLRPHAVDGVLLIGPRRSSTPPHVDPGFTAAWNLLLHGRKRWCFFPPHTPREVIFGDSSEETSQDIAACALRAGGSYWWADRYPQLRSRAAELGLRECIQQPREIIYVPQGWWHAAINLDENTTALTHNLVPRAALPSAFAMAVIERPGLARRWWRCLREFSPKAAELLQMEVPDIVQKALEAKLDEYDEYDDEESLEAMRMIDELLPD